MTKRIVLSVLIVIIIFSRKNVSCYVPLGELDQNDYPELWSQATTVYEFTVKDLNGNDVPLEKYNGLVLVITNIATHCSLSSSAFSEFKYLQNKYYSKGLRILGFPCSQFLFEEPYDNTTIKNYVKGRRLNFDVFANVDVNGRNASELWKFLKRVKKGFIFDCIKWNFTKFIVDRNGVPVERLTVFNNNKDFEKKILMYL
ncbi:probable glutathione peroxidase 2 [Sipha flava]|uniref:Glutathione peroxidase n=1 Tax=Sipha flava TaxID=143950 RepID=A0A2S2Q985_9HEMI|nr:probable glutathione peroxidase 2 [Sipha flava]